MTILPQVIANCILTAAQTLLVAMGLTLIHRVGRFLHLAHGAFFTGGGFLLFLFSVRCGLPLLFSILLSVGFSTAGGCLLYVAVYREIRRRRSSDLILVLASLAVYLVLQNVASAAFGNDTKIVSSAVAQEAIDILRARVTPVQIVTVIAGAAAVFAISVLSRTTRVGKAMRAIADDPELAAVSGVNTGRVILFTFALAIGLVTIAGILVCLDVGVNTSMGVPVMMTGVVAAVVGGRKKLLGVVFGALLIGVARNLAAWQIGSEWEEATVFVVLLCYLFLRPKSFLAGKTSAATA